MSITYYRTEDTQIFTSYKVLGESQHLLIAGQPGTGKTVVLNGILGTIVAINGPSVKFALIDPKGYDMQKFKGTVFCWGYAETDTEAVALLRAVIEEIERRNDIVKRNGWRSYHGDRLVVVAEEMLFLMGGCQKREIQTMLTRIMAIGRTCRVSFFGATQVLRASVLPTVLTGNFTHSLCLRVKTSTDSRLVIGKSGAELLPHHGTGIFSSPDYLDPVLIDLPLVTEDWTQARIDYYKRPDAVVGRNLHRLFGKNKKEDVAYA